MNQDYDSFVDAETREMTQEEKDLTLQEELEYYCPCIPKFERAWFSDENF